MKFSNANTETHENFSNITLNYNDGSGEGASDSSDLAFSKKMQEFISQHALNSENKNDIKQENNNRERKGSVVYTHSKLFNSSGAPMLSGLGAIVDSLVSMGNADSIAYKINSDTESARMTAAKTQGEIQQKSIQDLKEKIEKLQHGFLAWLGKVFGGKVAKIIGLVLAAVAVAAAVASGGALAIVAAGVIFACVAMATFTKIDPFAKAIQGLSDVLQKCGVPKETAQIIATVVVILAVIAISAGAAAGAAADSALVSARTLSMISQASKAATVINGADQVVVGASNVDRSIKTYHIAKAQDLLDAVTDYLKKKYEYVKRAQVDTKQSLDILLKDRELVQRIMRTLQQDEAQRTENFA